MTGIIKFVKRGGTKAATITSSELAAHEDGGNPPEPLETSRVQDLELPKELNVIYINIGADYQQGVQKSTRQTVPSIDTETVGLPIVMDDSTAKQVVDSLHYTAWLERTSYKLSLSRKWARLEPTDIIEVQYQNSSLMMRIVNKEESSSGVILLDCVAEDGTIYNQTGTGGASANIINQVITVPVQTIAYLLDIPLLREADNDAGVYFAAVGLRAGWKGCTIYKSNDSGTTYSPLLSHNVQAVTGTALNAIGDFSGGNIFDELNYIDVEMSTGTLSSISEILTLNGGNYALVGNELIQFKNAELVAVDTYRLTGLLRGRRGTEWAMPSHFMGETFILISEATIRRVPLETSEIGLERDYKFVSFSSSLQQTRKISFTSTAQALECFSPVLPGAGRNGANDILIKWVMRARYAADWRNYVDVSVTEAAENYEIDIYDSSFSTIKRTLTSSTTSVTYSSANQITDFGINQNNLYVEIYQISSVVGRGRPLRTIISVGRNSYYSNRWRVLINDLQGTESYWYPSVHEVSMHGVVGGPDLCTGGTAVGSANNADSYKAFDNNDSTYWNGGAYSLPQWIEYQFPSSVDIAQVSIRCTNTYLSVKDFALQYYDGASWQSVYIITDIYWAGAETKTFTI